MEMELLPEEMQMDKLLIIGASGHGKVIADIALATKKYREITFADDDENISECMGFPVIGKVSDLKRWMPEYEMIVAIGNAKTRRRIMEQIVNDGGTIATLIHPKAVVSDYATIGTGTVVMPGAVINAGTVLGKGCIVNTSASVDHDCTLEDYVHVSVGAHLAGTVSVGACTWVGIGAVVSNNIHICGNCMIGAGAVVVKDIDVPGTYVGVPARLV